MPMNKYVEHILSLYKQNKISHDAALSLLDTYKATQQENPVTDDSIAVIGLSCRMPKADSKEEFWNNLKKGINCVDSFPKERRVDIDPLIPFVEDNITSVDQPYWKGGFLSSVSSFDNGFFEILSSEAKLMDPQQRVFLEVAHTAFEDSGYTRAQLKGSNTSVFIGDVLNEYQKIVSEVSPLAVVGNVSPFIASRISYFYNLHGSAINVSTTCSTSLVALHLACQSLLSGESNLSLVGSVNLRLFPFTFKDDPVEALGIATDKGACFAFDNRASGIVRGEGAGAVVLKRYKDALKDGNHIYALIRGSSVNNDGKSSNVGSPNPLAQAELLKNTWEKSQINPEQISYIEAHGTGTYIGDPIEVQGISKAFSEFTQKKQFCAIGSVKTNIGHLTGGASGLASFIKTILSLHHEQIPPSLHFESPNQFIDFPNSPVYVASRLSPWPRSSSPRLAGVSAFGFNGTNCHVVLEEAPLVKTTQTNNHEFLPFLFTHKTEKGLHKLMQKHLDFLIENTAILNPEDVSYTLAKGKDHYKKQLLLRAHSINELILLIKKFLLNANSVVSEKNDIDWDQIFEKLNPHLISLPTYVFESKKFWLSSTNLKNRNLLTLPHKKTTPPLTEKEPLLNTVIAIFQEVMEIESIEAKDNFLELGGDSLMGIEVISIIHQRLNKKISYHDLFQYPVIQDLAALLEKKELSSFEKISKSPPQEDYPLSYAQKRLWILHHMQEHPIAYNIYDTFQFSHKIDIRLLQKSLNELTNRHVAFRTIFLEKEGEPFQKLAEFTEINLEILPVESLDVAYKSIELLKNHPFNLRKGPLVRAVLLQLPAEESFFFFMVHHIICDGWSIRIIIEELLKLYKGIALTPLAIDLFDYCQWQHQVSSVQRFKLLENYWLQKFKERPPLCEIRGDLPRPTVFNFLGKRKKILIEREDVLALSSISTKVDATLFMALLASIYVLIYRYSGQTDLVVGSPISGRFHADLRHLVGFFVNTLALRVNLCPEQKFSDLLETIKTQLLTDFEHQDYPFDLLVDKLKLERDTSHSPLFNINVAFQNFELDSSAQSIFDGLGVKSVDIPHTTCKWDLEFEFIKKSDSSLECLIEYYEEIYSEKMISSIISTYENLLSSIAKGDNCKISSLPIHPSSSNISGPIVEYKSEPIHKTFEKIVEKHPKISAILAKNQQVTYRKLNQRANQIAHFLTQKICIQKEESVGIFFEHGSEAIASILAILKCGGVYVPLDIKAPLERSRYIIEECKIRIILSQQKYIEQLNDLQWSTSLESFSCFDKVNLETKTHSAESNFMDTQLWNQVADEAEDDITSSGWVSSYTGAPFSREEMDEYGLNVLNKLKPFLHNNCRVLEIGCGSGLTAFTIAPYVGFYLGTDLSSRIIEKNQDKAQLKKLHQLHFSCVHAHEIDGLEEKDFDLVIINSVIHCFPGLNYFKNVLEKSIQLLNSNAVIFLGDLLDFDKKEQLKSSLHKFKESPQAQGLRTKLNWEKELFISKDFLSHLRGLFNEITHVKFSSKEHSIKNELTRFRFDTLLEIDKNSTSLFPTFKKQYNAFELEKYSDENLDLNISDRNLAYILFTSGSTGSPKGVLVEHHSLQNYMNWAISFYKLEKPCFPLYSSLNFDLTVTSIFLPILSGGHISIINGEIDEVIDSLEKNKDSNIIKITPTHLSLISEKKYKLPSIKKFILGGEAFYTQQAIDLIEASPQALSIFNEYGPTEATIGCIAHEWHLNEKTGPVLIGSPISNCTVHILDENKMPVPIGGVGEIIIEGSCLSRGYLNNNALSEKKFPINSISGNKTYHTGDLAQYLPSKKILYLGRKDRQVKIKGHRIELDEIESCLLGHSCIKVCIVAMKNNSENEPILHGYYFADVELSSEGVREFLSELLPTYMIPTALIQLKKLPVNQNGKIDLKLLEAFKSQDKKKIEPPLNSLEHSLHEIWSRVLNIAKDKLSVCDDFFDLGGDSIMAMRILPQVKKAGLTLSIKEIFQYRTIRALCAQTFTATTDEPISEINEHSSFNFSPAQQWFLDLKLQHSNYFTMAYLFKVPENINLDLLNKAFFKCFEHHETLRLIFKNNTQEYCSISDLSFKIETYDISHLDSENQQKAILKRTSEIQSSFNLLAPPLLKAALFNLGNNEKRLFLTLHHMVIDGVSWRILLEDLTNLYTSSLTCKLPSKTKTFEGWVKALEQQQDITKPLPWTRINPTILPKLSQTKSCLIGETEEEFIRLSKENTATLISNAKSFHQANINELLLASLMLSINETFGFNKILINHEGHGRTALEDFDVTRTLGWFTTIYPILLEKEASPSLTLKKIKQNLEEFSQYDLLYCVQRYLFNNSHFRNFNPEILFNYFGRFDNDLLFQEGDQLFENSTEAIASTSHQANLQPYLIEINSIIIEDQLRVSIIYNKTDLERNTFVKWKESFRKQISNYVSEKEKCLLI
ncbi:MAG: D-alanine--D-alanyl carrier protein ligase [Chlamydiae bacterium]|nr:D-alanine--D-alanyl carrier protein ligase [Chlamydiota bacterium]